MATPRRKPVTQDIDGQPCSPYFSPVLYRQVPNFEPQDGEIMQVTYPLSGSNWMQQIIQLILSRGESVETYNEFLEKAPFLEVQEVKATKSPRLLRTHFPMSKLRVSKKAKCVYVARNPWDCSVSCYHLIQEMSATNFATVTFDDFLDAFLSAQIGYGDYFEHLLLGYSHRKDPNVSFVTYEELHRNKKGVVLRLASFLGEHHRKAIEEREDVFQRVLDKSSVAFMKDLMKTNPTEGLKGLRKNAPHLQPAHVLNNQTSCDTSDVHSLRKVEIGDWKQHSTPESIRKMQVAINE